MCTQLFYYLYLGLSKHIFFLQANCKNIFASFTILSQSHPSYVYTYPVPLMFAKNILYRQGKKVIEEPKDCRTCS